MQNPTVVYDVNYTTKAKSHKISIQTMFENPIQTLYKQEMIGKQNINFNTTL